MSVLPSLFITNHSKDGIDTIHKLTLNKVLFEINRIHFYHICCSSYISKSKCY
jgi:hypothetical protein